MLRYCSIILCFAVAALVVLGLVMLTSTGPWAAGTDEMYEFVRKQSAMAVVGVVCAVIASRMPDTLLRRFWPWVLGLCCVLLALCYVPGIGVEIYGSKRWIHVPVINQFQPSELARLVGAISLAAWFARWQTETRTFWKGFVLPGAIIGAPILLIAGETDVGTALSMSVGCAAMFFCAGTRLFYLVPTALSAMSAAAFYIYHNENRMSRIEAWRDLEAHQLDKGMQQWRALLAFGNGGPTGVGLGNGAEKFGTLTFAHIDFIFPEIGEELGLCGTLLTVLCYVLIAVCGIGIAMQAKTMFSRLLAIGLTCMIVVPAMQNIAVTTALLPNDGLPLPFVSYGGSSIVFALVGVGLLVGIHRKACPEEVPELALCRQKKHAIRL
ncbi:MAG TPA: putative peptidoglycan glycosyltransferase FtsW [Luteolibacter sp.]